MPLLTRTPAAEGLPPAWKLALGDASSDEAAHAALEKLLEAGAGRTLVELDPGGDVRTWRVELCEVCPIMKWRAPSPVVFDVSLSKTTLKALTELWKLVLEGGSEYSFEVLDLTQGPNNGAQTFLTLAPRAQLTS
jgi:hypothetical protein